MNCFNGFTRPCAGGYHAMLRFARDGEASPVMGEGGTPIIFPTELEAHKAVTAHLLRYFNGQLRRDGDRIASIKAAADAIFRPGKKPIPVERRARA